MLQRLGRLHLYLTSISFWACWTDLNDPKYQVSYIATSSSPLVGIQIQPIARMACLKLAFCTVSLSSTCRFAFIYQYLSYILCCIFLLCGK